LLFPCPAHQQNTSVGDRFYSLQVSAGGNYPEQPPSIKFENVVALPGIVNGTRAQWFLPWCPVCTLCGPILPTSPSNVRQWDTAAHFVAAISAQVRAKWCRLVSCGGPRSPRYSRHWLPSAPLSPRRTRLAHACPATINEWLATVDRFTVNMHVTLAQPHAGQGPMCGHYVN